MRFIYRDPDCAHPILVERVYPPGAGGAIWVLDYDRSQLASISYGLWLRIDCFAIDALEYFSFSQTLIRPAAFEIAARGGWYPWQWNSQILRTQKCLQLFGLDLIEPQILAAYLPPLELAPPSPWQVRPVHEDPECLGVVKLWEEAALQGHVSEEAYFRAHSLISRFPVFMDESETRMLVPAPADESQDAAYAPSVLDSTQRPGERTQTFLYLDESCLLHPIQIERLPGNEALNLKISCPKYAGQAGLGLAFLSDRSAAGEIKQADNPRNFHQQKTITPPEWVENRIRLACFSAIATLTPDTATGRTLPDLRLEYSVGSFPEGHDREAIFSNLSLLGAQTLQSYPQEAVYAAKPETLASLEIESAARQSYGDWYFDPASTTLANRKTGQTLTLSDASDVPRSHLPRFLESPTWWLLTYRDAEVCYSLPVARGAETASASMFVPFFFNRPSSYGLWRRLLLAISDGLSCWPETNQFKGATGGVRCLGGWSNGRWRKNLLVINFSGSISLETAQPNEILLPDVDAKAPSPWEFIDSSSTQGDAWLSGLTWERPSGSSTNNETKYFAAGPLNLTGQLLRPLSGFQGKTPYLRRKNGSAVFFPAHVISVMASDLRGEFQHRASRIVCIYADQDFSAVFLQSTMERMTFDIQDASLNPKDHLNLQIQNRKRGRYEEDQTVRVPDWLQCCSLQERFLDLGSAWEGSYVSFDLDDLISPPAKAFHLRAEASPLSLGPCTQTSLKGRYRGGKFQPDASQHVSLMSKDALR
ncbi:hypothetical protein [Denitrobaculum tricleocarpae]|uniref:Uncharacterized protein n=1 Tax=Denitrobaculum tricleocarpae TaxID=2591009 RepID=A0A545TPR4_9PROT|nr:hypothetical protein [Denitrobaculum tricleocarpae]TQV79204.1 hypothetical protein FKG95_16215 [Denitrobaculum tricleocarpae]